jgi:hypothetical protein
MLDIQQAEVAEAPPAETRRVLSRRECAPSSADDVTVCGDQDPERYRLRPLPPLPKSESLLSRPLRVTILPGVSVGFQKGGGFGVKVQTGPGRKSDD